MWRSSRSASTIVDVPTVRKHKLSNTSVTAQSYVIVQLRLANGVEGIGEAATLGGPRWSEESVEGIKSTVDGYLAPALLGHRADHVEAAGIRMNEAAKRNTAAKGAIETAMWDALGLTLGLPVTALLGGAVRDRVPVLWTLASGDPVQEVDEAEAEASGPAASHVQGEDRRAGAGGRHGAAARTWPPRWRAGRG